MAVFLELVTDSFEEVFRAETTRRKGLTSRAGSSTARRPVRGLEIKPDSYAVLKVLFADGTEIPLFDSGGKDGRSTSYTNFMIQSVNEARMEKMQIVETFGDDYVFFFGEQPRFLDIASVVVTSQDFNWLSEFLSNYELYLRGTRCAEVGARVYLFVDDIIVDGYMVMCQAARDAQNPLSATLQFRLFVTNYDIVSLVGDPNYPVPEGIDIEALKASAGTRGGVDPKLLYGLISDNKDEWVGPADTLDGTGEGEANDATGLSGDHPEDLDKAVSSVGRDGGAIVDQDALGNLGMLQDGKAATGDNPSAFFGMTDAAAA